MLGVYFVYIMSGVRPVNSSEVTNDLRTIFENLTYGLAPEADNVAQVYVGFNCHFHLTHAERIFVLAFSVACSQRIQISFLADRIRSRLCYRMSSVCL